MKRIVSYYRQSKQRNHGDCSTALTDTFGYVLFVWPKR